MTTNTAPLGERTAVDIRAIERELNDLWRQANEGHPDVVSRVCVLNLVVPVTGHALAEEATAVITQLMTRHPNRAIVVVSTPDAPESLAAWVQANCQLPGQGRAQVCCEQITIEAGGSGVARVPGTILPLLVPDVPTVLWWPRGEPFGDPLFEKLAGFADRAIIDSATFATPEHELTQLAGLSNGMLRVSDMAWGRLTPWRELLAQFFDAPALVPQLGQLSQVSIDYEAPPGTPDDRIEALLLVAWLGSRLGWGVGSQLTVAEGVSRCTLIRTDGQEVAVELRPQAATHEQPGRLLAAALRSANAHFRVELIDQPGCAAALAELPGREPLRRIVRLEKLNEADLIAEELRLLGRDAGFEGALRLAAALRG